jgi:hypothetical protein
MHIDIKTAVRKDLQRIEREALRGVAGAAHAVGHPDMEALRQIAALARAELDYLHTCDDLTATGVQRLTAAFQQITDLADDA